MEMNAEVFKEVLKSKAETFQLLYSISQVDPHYHTEFDEELRITKEAKGAFQLRTPEARFKYLLNFSWWAGIIELLASSDIELSFCKNSVTIVKHSMLINDKTYTGSCLAHSMLLLMKDNPHLLNKHYYCEQCWETIHENYKRELEKGA